MFLKKVARVVPGLYMVNAGCVALGNILWKDDDHHKLNDKVVLGKEFHISLGRTVPIQLHHIDSVVAMLRHRLRFQRRSDLQYCSLVFIYVVAALRMFLKEQSL